MTFDEILKLDDRLLPLYQECTAHRVILVKSGKPGRICWYGCRTEPVFVPVETVKHLQQVAEENEEITALSTGEVKDGRVRLAPALERFADREHCYPDPDFCNEPLWHGMPQDQGEVGIKYLLNSIIASNDTLWPHREHLLEKFFNDMPPCTHPIEKSPWEVVGTGGQRFHGVEVVGHEGPDYPVPEIGPRGIRRGQLHVKKDGTIVPNTTPAVRSLIDMLGHDDDEALAEACPLGMTQDLATGAWTYKLPKDEGDPCYIVLSEWEAHRLAHDLEYRDRLKRGEISKRYFNESIYVCGPQQRDLLLSDDLTKHTITGYLAYKNVVLTFADRDLEHKLASVCRAVATVLPMEPKATTALRQSIAERPGVFNRTDEEVEVMQLPRWFPTPAAMRAPFQRLSVISDTAAETSDMPEEVLDGWLGELCRTRMSAFPIAYAWPALLSAASVLVPKCGSRTNLYVGIVGPPGSGKSSAFDYAFELLGLKEPTLQRLKAGSAEGLSQYIGDVDGAPRLFFPDELSHLLKKASIEGSTFPQFLNTMYYHDQQESTIAHQKLLKMKCRLSIAGGIPEEQFNEDFGAETTHGLYDRFMLSLCPTGFLYNYRPFEGDPAFSPSSFGEEDAMTTAPGHPIAVSVDDSVWRGLDEWRSSGIDGRAVEAAVRAAVICAAFDARGLLRADDLTPALALAKYQSRIRQMLAPNPGKNTGGVLDFKILAHLQNHAPNGEWVYERAMLKAIHAWHFGAGAAERELQALAAAGEIERAKHGGAKVCRLNLGRLD